MGVVFRLSQPWLWEYWHTAYKHTHNPPRPTRAFGDILPNLHKLLFLPDGIAIIIKRRRNSAASDTPEKNLDTCDGTAAGGMEASQRSVGRVTSALASKR